MVHSSISAFGGEKVLKPVELFIAGRANTCIQNQIVSIEEIAMSAIKDWLRKNLRFLDVEKSL